MCATLIVILTLIFSLYSVGVAAQDSAKADTTLLTKEVSVDGERRVTSGSVGSRITAIDASTISYNKSKSLSELLQDNTTINIKSVGQGALSTASLRGTSSSHTQVLWNGISLNSSMLGSFDFSQIPIYFVDDVAIYHGSSAQQSGSGAIGGSVNFTSNSSKVEVPYLSILSEYGSNNTITEGSTFKISKNNFTSTTKLYYQQSDNDYLYLNNIYSMTPTYERRENADYRQAGYMQEFYFITTKGDNLELISWGQFDNRSLPQSILVSTAATEQIESTNIRNYFSYSGVRGEHRFKISTAYLDGSFDYTRVLGTYTDQSDNRNYSLIARGDYELLSVDNMLLGASLNYRYDAVVSSSYQSGRVSRNSTSARVFARYMVSQKLHIDADVTAEMVDDDVFAIYNLSARYRVVGELLAIKATHAYNYRVPTLNDLYWNPGGNIDLNPENGYSWDISLLSEPTIGSVDMKFELSYYRLDINDWIIWLPQEDKSAIWSPVNYAKVLSQGVEFYYQFKYQTDNFAHRLFGNYGYAYSVGNSNNGDDSYRKQLAYIPPHKWNANYELYYNNRAWFNYNISFTDIRYTSADEEYFTDSYLLHSVEIGTKIGFNSSRLSLSFRVDNLFNAYYESTEYYPMPLRMYRIGVRYSY
ncbi:MAG: TonB-dependent receptor [Rikenellaceae bacterium]